MYEYIRPKQTSASKPATSHGVIQQRAIPAVNSYAGRNTKMGDYPRRETGSVIQLSYSGEWCTGCHQPLFSCKCADYNPSEDMQDSAYKTSSGQFLDPGALRKNLKVQGAGGEAHHILSGNVVKEQGWARLFGKAKFNESWNGIILHGTIKNDEIEHERLVDGPNILHRRDGQPGHPTYDSNLVTHYGDSISDLNDCKRVAEEIRNKIECSDEYCLDDLDF